MIKFWYSMDLSEIVNYMNYEAALDIFLSSSHDPLQAYPVAEIFCCIYDISLHSQIDAVAALWVVFIGIFFLRKCVISLATTIRRSKKFSCISIMEYYWFSKKAIIAWLNI